VLYLSENVNMEDTQKETMGNQEEVLLARVAELESLLTQGQVLNNKLATCVQIFAQVHLSKREKVKIANDINNAISESAVDKIFEFYRKKYNLEEVTLEQEEYVFSEAFVSNMSKYYKSFRGYNPLEEIEAAMPPIEQFIFGYSQLQGDVDETRRNFLLQSIEGLLDTAASSASEIRRIASENK
jgi:hypothetical protein